MPESRGRMALIPMRIKPSLISVVTVALDGSHPTATIAIKKEWVQAPEFGLCVLVPTAENSLPVHLISVFMVPPLYESPCLITVYDVEIRKITLKLEGHSDDINAVCFADSQSTNVLFSGSDDSLVKVWDRRSMAGGREAGCLPGHMEGITFVAAKGDGRYVISNGKDQTLKLWDIRKMMERSAFERLPKKDFQSGFDYRWMVNYITTRGY